MGTDEMKSNYLYEPVQDDQRTGSSAGRSINYLDYLSDTDSSEEVDSPKLQTTRPQEQKYIKVTGCDDGSENEKILRFGRLRQTEQSQESLQSSKHFFHNRVMPGESSEDSSVSKYKKVSMMSKASVETFDPLGTMVKEEPMTSLRDINEDDVHVS